MAAGDYVRSIDMFSRTAIYLPEECGRKVFTESLIGNSKTIGCEAKGFGEYMPTPNVITLQASRSMLFSNVTSEPQLSASISRLLTALGGPKPRRCVVTCFFTKTLDWVCARYE
jgi:hypothetical protein